MRKNIFILSIFFSALALSGFMLQDDPKVSLPEFNRQLKENEKSLVYFSARWCVICPKLKPAIDEIEAEKTAGFKVLRIDTDRDREIAEEFEISSLPVLMIYRKGKREWIHVGLIEKAELKRQMESY